jgi:acyl-coenzyme A synthetase/AMP-(fatty) acid ligase
MSAALNDSAAGYPLAVGELQRGLAVHAAGQVDLAAFLRHVHGVAALLPPGQHAINLCEDRYRFLVGFCAVALRGQVTLLPSSRAPAVVADVRKRYPATWCLSDSALDDAVDCLILPRQLPEVDGAMPMLPAEQLVAIGFTSGSTGTPTANAKTWGAFVASTGQNLAALSDLWGQALPSVVATVPPQHMYGMELSVLFPLLAPACVHAGKPFFPEDVAAALAQAPAPRLLVTTPVHLRALLRSGVQLPVLAGIVTATAPLPQELAVAAEAQFATEVREMFGSTETCIFARRRTARDVAWTLLPGVQLHPHADGTAVQAPHLAAPVVLADVMELAVGGRRFTLLGRRADLLEIAGKRASLGDLTKRLLAVEGVEDAALLQLPPEPGQVISRLAALVVAPTLDEAQILQALRTEMDPVFLPRPLRKVAVLPRNETGKLPRDALLALLRG